MPTPTKGPRLGSGPAHEKLLIANLARALFTHGRIRTTLPKAKKLRPQAERLITLAKRGDVASRRQVQTVLRDTTWRKPVLHSLFNEIAPRYADRPGGYTRILKLGPRPGDNAPMAIIELVGREMPLESEEESGGRRRRFGRRRSAAPDGANRAERRAAARGRLATPEHVHDHDEAEAEAADEGAEREAAAEDEQQLPQVPTDAELAEDEAERGTAEAADAPDASAAEADDDEGGQERPKDP